MSIGSIGAVGSPAAPPVARPESAEVPGAPDNDHDGDEAHAATTTTGSTATRSVPGQVDVKA